MTRHGSSHRHLYQQVLDVFKDKGRLSEAIRFTRITQNTPLEMGKYSHGFYLKTTKDNNQLRRELGNHDHQKNYADMRCQPLEIQVGGKVMLKVSPWERVIQFAKRGKLKPRYIGPFKILAKERIIKLSKVHSTMHVSNMKECLFIGTLDIPQDEIQINDKLHFLEEPVEIIDREVKRLKQSRIPIIKVRWNSRRGPEFT
ncbi:hypothetical protein Tco_0732287 [Tanacetum coccineum]